MSRIIQICNLSPAPPSREEILRYAGTKGESSEELSSLLDSCITEAEKSISYKLCFAEFDIKLEDEFLDLGFARTSSLSLATNLRDCTKITLFAATLGLDLDRAIARSAVLSPARALLLDAIGSERIEALCNEFCRTLSERAASEGYSVRPRFSAGYGDLPLSLQRNIFDALDCKRKIGLTLNESLIMSPSKSVTAIVGLAKKS